MQNIMQVYKKMFTPGDYDCIVKGHQLF